MGNETGSGVGSVRKYLRGEMVRPRPRVVSPGMEGGCGLRHFN